MKLPEPTHYNPAGRPFYTEAQCKQYAKDALEAAAQLFPQPHAEYFGSNIQDAIRNLAKEIV